MSHHQKIIKSQQAALKSMGLYTGPVDGDWGMRSIAAMAALQHHPAYFGCDANASNQPLQIGMKLPQGWAWAQDEDEQFVIVCSESELAEIAKKKEEADAEIEKQRLAGIELAEKEEAERKELEAKELLEKQELEKAELEKQQALEAETAKNTQAPADTQEPVKSADDIELEKLMAEEEAGKNTQAPAAPADTKVA